MLNKLHYANGQKTFEHIGDKMKIFYKNGNVKAVGKYVNSLMEGEWKFYRENGQLWQIGNFKNGKKDGSWIRYDRANNLEYKEMFKAGKVLRSLQ